VEISPFGVVSMAAHPGSEIRPHVLAMKRRFTVAWYLIDAQTLIAPPGTFSFIPPPTTDHLMDNRIKRRSSFADHLKSKHGINADVVDIDAFAPPLLPALAKQRKTRGKSLKVITDIPATDECMESFDRNHGGMFRFIENVNEIT
jgi:hypothetical protein